MKNCTSSVFIHIIELSVLSLCLNFARCQAWLAEINEYAHDDVVIMLLGNKSDMTAERVVRSEDGERLAKVGQLMLISR